MPTVARVLMLTSQTLSILWLLSFSLGFTGDATPINNKKVSVLESVFDSSIEDIRWLGSNFKTVLCRTKSGGFYRSIDSGRTWTDALKLLQTAQDAPEVHQEGGSIRIETIHLHPKSHEIVVVVGKKHSHYISTDAAQTFRLLNHNQPIHGFQFHPVRLSWALMSHWTEGCLKSKNAKASEKKKDVCRHDLFVTKNFGNSFQRIAHYVVQYSWGSPEMGQEDCIFFSQYRSSLREAHQPSHYRYSGWSESIDFNYMPSPSGSIHRLVDQGNKFLISKDYIFVAKVKDSKQQSVVLLVSRDGGRTFKEAKLPVGLQEKSYSILDASQHSVIIHVNHGHPTREGIQIGNVYISDAEGLRYSLSLPQNIRGPLGECEFDAVASLEGFYIANFYSSTDTLENKNDKTTEEGAYDEAVEDDYPDMETGIQQRRRSARRGKDEAVIRTVMSFDKGGVWSYLKPPTIDSRGSPITCDGSEFSSLRRKRENGTEMIRNQPDKSWRTPENTEGCWLHLHGISNYHRFAPFYCVSNAVGLIMGTGNVGSHLNFNEDQVNTYLSRDGGLTWSEVHKGAYIYEFGDHGGLIVMADDTKATNQVVFSWNEGQSWYDFDLGEQLVNVDNIVIEPNSSSVEFLLYGTRGVAGVIYHLDFESLAQPMCKGPWAADSVASDYQTWSPSDGRTGDQCILGKKLIFTRRKATSECFNGREFSRPVERKNCTCTERDYECEFGFTRSINSLECVPEDKSLTQQGCVSSGIFYAKAYRKVPGDTCTGGWTPPKVPILCPTSSPIRQNSKMFLAAMGVLAFFLFITSYIRDIPWFQSFLDWSGLSRFLSPRIPYTPLSNHDDHYSTRPDHDFYGGGYSGSRHRGETTTKETKRDFIYHERNPMAPTRQAPLDENDEDHGPPLLEFSSVTGNPVSQNSLGFNRHLHRPNTTNDMFFSNSQGVEQRDTRISPPTLTPTSTFLGDAASAVLQHPQPIPKLQPPPLGLEKSKTDKHHSML